MRTFRSRAAHAMPSISSYPDPAEQGFKFLESAVVETDHMVRCSVTINK